MINVGNILNAFNYESLCDFSIVPPYGKNFDLKILSQDATIFCKTDFIDYLFDNIKQSKYSYNLITHHSDHPIDLSRWSLKPECIKRWYAVNATYSHPNLISIPLGLKTHMEPYLEPQYMTEWFACNIERLKLNKKEKNIYCNWNITNVDRNKIKNVLKNKQLEFTYQNNIPFNEYIEEMSKHRFVISPVGNGIDCHRTWEALYVGCIPIVIKNSIYDNWNLPILQVSSYEDITQNLLDEFNLNNFTLEQLEITYWSDAIKRGLKNE